MRSPRRSPAAQPETAPAPEPSSGNEEPDDSSSSGGGGSVHYKNCAAAKAAHAAPVRRGDPGYGRHLDRDGDGVACE
ncbi:excalibur calcium-binding domain-containing protein [Streptomyces virginiae]|uniref:excalibur calcium-binding domain-containing protein n=1 Tax=Streptomyces virginiae TaxID=1961 RepID=UPI003F6D9C9C